MKKIALLMVLVLLSMVLSGCYNKTIDSSSSGVKTSSGKVEEVVDAGWYFSMHPMAGLNVIDHSAKTFSWYDPDLVTRDKQPIGIAMSVTVQRSTNSEDVTQMWNTYRAEATNDSALEQQVLGRVPGVAKAITTKYTLDEMLGVVEGAEASGRQRTTEDINTMLTVELAEIYVKVLDVRITNIEVDPAYLDLLKQKAQAAVSQELAQETTSLRQQELLQEEAVTQIELEKARRARLVEEEKANVYKNSPELLEIEKMRIWANAVGQGSVYFIPSDANLFMGTPNVVPAQ